MFDNDPLIVADNLFHLSIANKHVGRRRGLAGQADKQEQKRSQTPDALQTRGALALSQYGAESHLQDYCRAENSVGDKILLVWLRMTPRKRLPISARRRSRAHLAHFSWRSFRS